MAMAAPCPVRCEVWGVLLDFILHGQSVRLDVDNISDYAGRGATCWVSWGVTENIDSRHLTTGTRHNTVTPHTESHRIYIYDVEGVVGGDSLTLIDFTQVIYHRICSLLRISTVHQARKL